MSRFEVTIRRLDEAEVVEDDDDAPVVFHYFPGKGRKRTSHSYEVEQCSQHFERLIRPAFEGEAE